LELAQATTEWSEKVHFFTPFSEAGGDDIPAYLERNDDEQLPNAVAVAAIDDGEECPDDLPRPTDPMFPLYVN